MKDHIPEYFLALIKQFANLSSNQQAERAVINISESLDKCLDYYSRRLFFDLVPNYLDNNHTTFLSNLKTKNTYYDHSILVDRIKLKQNLTDDVEVKNLLKAYIETINIIVGPSSAAKIKNALPTQLISDIYQ